LEVKPYFEISKVFQGSLDYFAGIDYHKNHQSGGHSYSHMYSQENTHVTSQPKSTRIRDWIYIRKGILRLKVDLVKMIEVIQEMNGG
jgi:hypothetical protein